MNARNTRNPPENDCESLWGTGLAETKFVTATVRLNGDQSKAQRVQRPAKHTKPPSKRLKAAWIPMSTHRHPQKTSN